MNNNPYQPPNAESDDAIDQSVSEADRFPARNVLLKLDTANLVVWFAIYALFAIVLKLMIDGLYTSYEYPFLQIVTGFVVPMTAFIIGIVANILLLGSVGFGKWLAGIRVVMSSIAAVVSVPLLGYESKFTIAEYVTNTIPTAAICTGCLLYYCYYLRRIYAR